MLIPIDEQSNVKTNSMIGKKSRAPKFIRALTVMFDNIDATCQDNGC